MNIRDLHAQVAATVYANLAPNHEPGAFLVAIRTADAFVEQYKAHLAALPAESDAATVATFDPRSPARRAADEIKAKRAGK